MEKAQKHGTECGDRPDAWTVPKVASADFDTFKPMGAGYDGFDGWTNGKGPEKLGMGRKHGTET